MDRVTTGDSFVLGSFSPSVVECGEIGMKLIHKQTIVLNGNRLDPLGKFLESLVVAG